MVGSVNGSYILCPSLLRELSHIQERNQPREDLEAMHMQLLHRLSFEVDSLRKDEREMAD
jgi:hypothetical protein